MLAMHLLTLLIFKTLSYSIKLSIIKNGQDLTLKKYARLTMLEYKVKLNVKSILKIPL